MFDSLPGTVAHRAATQLEAAVSELLQLDRTAMSGPELLELLRLVETEMRRLSAVDVANLAEVDARHLASDVKSRDTAALLVDMLRVDPIEARQRVNLARDLGTKTALSGERLEPTFPAVSKTLAAGSISAGHARRISDFFGAIPAAVATNCGETLQEQLLDVAQQTTPTGLAKFCHQLAARLDQDGREPSEKLRHRGFSLATGTDGWSRATGLFSPELTATVTALLDSLAAPQPGDDETPDERTATQRRHDALLDAGLRLLRSGDLPDSGGAAATVLVTISETSLRERVGYGETAHGTLVPVEDVLRLASDAQLIPVVLNDAGGVIAYGRGRRLASREQRRALAARDHGCSFPGCTAPPGWCETHHVISWLDGGPSDLDNMTLLCGHHHRSFRAQGWECQMIAGVPHWKPPEWRNPDRRPRRNRAHCVERK